MQPQLIISSRLTTGPLIGRLELPARDLLLQVRNYCIYNELPIELTPEVS